jgi:hypothetical protein
LEEEKDDDDNDTICSDDNSQDNIGTYERMPKPHPLGESTAGAGIVEGI